MRTTLEGAALHRSTRNPITIVVAIAAALAVSLGLLAVPAGADPDPPEPTPGIVEVGVLFSGEFPGEEPTPFELDLDARGVTETVIDHEAGTLAFETIFAQSSFEAYLGDLGQATVNFQMASDGPAMGTFDPETAEAAVDLDVEIVIEDLMIHLPDGDQYAYVTECFVNVDLALDGAVEDGTGVFSFGPGMVEAVYDPEAAPCYLNGDPEYSLAGVMELLLGTSTTDGQVVLFTSGPSAPQEVEAIGGPLSAYVSWLPPLHTGGLPVESYLIEIVGTERSLVTSSQIHAVTVIGLEEGESYQFQVQAMTALGWSEPSEPTDAVVIGPATVEFSDVDPEHAFFAEITWLAEEGISTGYEDGTFMPAGTLSREAMAAFLYRMAGSPEIVLPDEPTFSDVPETNEFYEAIEWMWQNGLTSGYEDGTFHPTGGLTRQAMAAFLYRAAGWPGGEDPTCVLPPFDDVPVDQAFCGEISWLSLVGITTGYPDGDFLPEEDLTRQAMSAFLYRYLLVEPGIMTGVG
jgi:hypothetical protein